MVVLYSRPLCAPCNTLKYLLNKRGIEYQEQEPDDSVWIFPTVVIGDTRIEGYNLSAVLAALASQPATA